MAELSPMREVVSMHPLLHLDGGEREAVFAAGDQTYGEFRLTLLWLVLSPISVSLSQFTLLAIELRLRHLPAAAALRCAMARLQPACVRRMLRLVSISFYFLRLVII